MISGARQYSQCDPARPVTKSRCALEAIYASIAERGFAALLDYARGSEAEVFGWLSTFIVVGIALGTAVGGRLITHSGPHAAMPLAT